MKLVKLNAADNVAFASDAIEPGDAISLAEGEEFSCSKRMEPGAKIALCDIAKGGMVRRCSVPIGTAAVPIHTGEFVTREKLMPLAGREASFSGTDTAPEIRTNCSFSGYSRPDGKTGIRNEIWILPLSEETEEVSHDLADLCDTVKFPKVDGVVSFSFPGVTGEEGIRAFASLTHHPNAAGVLIPVRNRNEPAALRLTQAMKGMDNSRIRILECSASENETGQGMALIHELAAAALGGSKGESPASGLVIGILSAFPTALSGLTSAPLLGVFTDRIIAQGASVVLSCPKLAGAAGPLSRRCRDETVFRKALKGIVCGGSVPPFTDFATPDEEAVFYLQPGGKAPVEEILKTGEPVAESGLSLLTQPEGNAAAMTALSASGAQIILAACGGDAPGCSPVPVVRLASSASSAMRCGGRFDFLAGSLAEDKTMPQVSLEFWNYFFALLSGGQKTKNEAHRHRCLRFF